MKKFFNVIILKISSIIHCFLGFVKRLLHFDSFLQKLHREMGCFFWVFHKKLVFGKLEERKQKIWLKGSFGSQKWNFWLIESRNSLVSTWLLWIFLMVFLQCSEPYCKFQCFIGPFIPKNKFGAKNYFRPSRRCRILLDEICIDLRYLLPFMIWAGLLLLVLIFLKFWNLLKKLRSQKN
jgi:hypothetical protein